MCGGLCAIGVLGALIARPAIATAERDTTATDDPSSRRDTTAHRDSAKSPPALEPLRDDDGLFSLNVSCPVRGGRLNPNINMVYVNRQPVGFC